ncbi:BspA family leucine-rich repeat surface protein, partial [uncultured Slackia sp.]|uniref:BspA family leucine-rich repeat surface protein n=1 Tax=uncultured Slackia sp. TaxID=665903 RepID=UPI0025DAE191
MTGVKTSEYADRLFGSLSLVETMDLSGLDVSSATDMSSMFSGCSKLASLDASGWSTSRVRSMSGMFYGCSSLASLDASGWDVSYATDMSGMFSGCSSLASLDVSGWDTSSVRDMGNMFRGCSSLASLDASGWDVSYAADKTGMFYGCSSLASLDASGWNVSNTTDMHAMFSGCSSLASLDVSGWNPSSATLMDSMFSGCSSLASLDVSGWDTSRVTGMSGMFYGCSSLASLDVSGWHTSSVTYMDSMFRGCSSLASLDVSGWHTSSVTYMDSMFRGCSSLASLDASGWDTSSVRDMGNMFDGCSSLASLDASGWDVSGVRNMDDMFYDCSRLGQIAVGYGFGLYERKTTVIEPSLIEGWTGKWVNRAGDAFPFASIPWDRDVYRAQIALRDDMFEVDCSDSPYIGSEITKEIRSSNLQEGVDYKVSYSDNVSAGTASISISGIGRAVGTLRYEFNITKALPALDALDATYGQKLADLALPEGFSWQDAGDASVGDPGEHGYLATYTPSDEANYEAARDVPVKVRVFRDVDASMFSVDAAGLVYDGTAHEPAVSSGVVPEGSYSVEYRDNVNAGEATAVVSGGGFYRGSCEIGFPIAKAAPEFEAPAPVEAAYGQTLSDVALPEGFSWQDDPSTSVGDAGEHEFLATFIPGDVSNYEAARDVPVKVRVFRDVDASMFSV